MAGQSPNQVSSAEAILVGALSSGVNAPTWVVLQITFLLLAFCFTAMLYLAFFSSDFVIVGHVLLLITIGAVLFVLLNRSPLSSPTLSPHAIYTLLRRTILVS
uniref:Uncharacterized protein n=1 Tax=Aegilops tauschii subsp. strangulata TaxID=200361 RepID=A0A453N3N6_AEGTS